MKKTTPMLRQYLEIKKQYPGTLLFFRLGDFYELFNEDAVIGSRELDITLTARHKKTENPVPMCGVPHHSAANYISRLVKKGFRVAICEQTEDAGATKKLVKREVVRVITPGTAIDEQLLEKKEPVFLASLAGTPEGDFGVSYLELSTGEFIGAFFSGSSAQAEALADIENFAPREIIFPNSLGKIIHLNFRDISNSYQNPDDRGGNVLRFDKPDSTGGFSTTLTELDEAIFDPRTTENRLVQHFQVKDLTGFGLAGKKETIRAAGACLEYARQTQKASTRHITGLNFFESNETLILDGITLRNLEIFESGDLEKDSRRSLLGVIDQTITGMGGRLLRSWILRPSVRKNEIETRLLAVEEFTDTFLRDQTRFFLREIADLERLIGRLNLGTATPPDILALNRSLSVLPEIRNTLADASSLLVQVLNENIFELPDLKELIFTSVSADAPVNLNLGGVIKAGFNPDLDELREISSSAKKTIAAFESEERRKTGINNLKVKFNNVFGYFIEISNSNLAKVPEEYERRQTLTNSERYTTGVLKEWEIKILGAEEKIKELEKDLFEEIRQRIILETRKLQSNARALATLDTLCSLAETAVRNDYVKPLIHNSDELKIVGGRHPIVEAFSSSPFVPNDLLMNNSTHRLLIITGANMGGKSTVLRQSALIQILAQIGSFVPAKSARLPLIDRIWTRVGASDDLASGRSTFMVEMTETANILHNATPRSLILLDEIGRGTSTFDGLSIAWAVAEYLHNSPDHSAKTMFATHYHELTELAENLPGAKNFQLTAREIDGEIVFLHKLEAGRASKSYGIAVAQLAGLPAPIIARAREVLNKLEEYELAVFNTGHSTPEKGLEEAAGMASKKRAATQVSLFAINNETIIDQLRDLNPEEISPPDALNLLLEMKKKII